MPSTAYLLIDPRGWPETLDPEMVSVIMQARLRPEVQLLALDERWYEHLPTDEAAVFLLLTGALAPGWKEAVRAWLNLEHRLYTAYLDSANPQDMHDLKALTAGQSPYRVAQQNAVGVENAARWVDEILGQLSGQTLPMVKVTPTRWRNLASNAQDAHTAPEEYTVSAPGVAGYKLVAASHRGKTHGHSGSFREDAVAIATTAHWNIMAVADGAGTAPLARVGSNMAVNTAVAAMSEAMPETPNVEDLGRAIWAGLRAAHTAIRNFAGEQSVSITDLHTTLQLMIHWPQPNSCLLGVAHVGDGIIAAETVDRQLYMLTEPDTDPDDQGRTLFLTSGPVRQWMERTKVYQFDTRLNIVALMTDGIAGDLEPYHERLQSYLFEALRQRVLCFPGRQREQALLHFISYDRRGSFDDRTLAVLSQE